MLKLKLQYFGHLMWRVDSLEKTLMLGGIGGRRRRGKQRMRWLDGITDSMDVSLSELWELVMEGRPGVLRFMGRKESDTTEQLNWTETRFIFLHEINLGSPRLVWCSPKFSGYQASSCLFHLQLWLLPLRSLLDPRWPWSSSHLLCERMEEIGRKGDAKVE